MHSLGEKSIGIIFGPNGAGKGTLARYLSDKYGYKHINTGALLRIEAQHREDLRHLLDEGEMVDDTEVERVLIDHFKTHTVTTQQKIVLEGVPRSKSQVKLIQKICNEFGYKVKWIISLELPVEVIIDRVKDRILAPDGNVYHFIYNPPPAYFKKEDFVKRLDDRPHIIKKRYENYMNSTKECINDPFFSGIPKFTIDATRGIREIYKEADEALS